jgi:hypothetical protein
MPGVASTDGRSHRNRKDSTGDLQSGTGWYGVARHFPSSASGKNERPGQAGSNEAHR